MAGIKDGRLLEDGSVPLVKMEVMVATQADFLQEVQDRIDADAAEALARSNADTTLQNNIDNHAGTGISTAHPGQINSEAQIPNTSIGFHKLTATPATQADFNNHASNGSIHFTLGWTGATASPGNHGSSGQHLPAGSDPLASGTYGISISGNAASATSAGNADTVDGQHASAFAAASHATTHQSGQSDALSGTLAVSITGNAATASYASYAGWAYYAG